MAALHCSLIHHSCGKTPAMERFSATCCNRVLIDAPRTPLLPHDSCLSPHFRSQVQQPRAAQRMSFCLASACRSIELHSTLPCTWCSTSRIPLQFLPLHLGFAGEWRAFHE